MYTKVDRDGDRVPNMPKIIAHVVLGIIFLVLLLGSFGTVSAGERGVKVRLGNVVGLVEPGLYFKLPLVEKVVKMNVKTQSVVYEREEPLAGASQDLQDVKIATVVNYHIDPTKVKEIYVQYGFQEDYEAQVVRPAVRDIVKATASQFTAEELVTKRAEFTGAVLAKLNERLTSKSAIVEQVNITNFEFSPAFTQAIEAKVTATQNAEAAKNKLEQVKFEAQQQVEKAKAEAETIKIQATAINSQGGADYVALQAIKQWDGHYPTTMLGGNSIPLIQLK